MQVSRALWASIPGLIAVDPLFLSSATAMKVKLVAEAFAPSLDLVIADLTLATAAGLEPIDAGIGDAQVFNDVAVGGKTVQLLEPAGGWNWERTDAVVAPETIHGYIVTDTAGTGLIGSGLLPAPVTLTGAGDAVNVDRIRFNIPVTMPVSEG